MNVCVGVRMCVSHDLTQPRLTPAVLTVFYRPTLVYSGVFVLSLCGLLMPAALRHSPSHGQYTKNTAWSVKTRQSLKLTYIGLQQSRGSHMT